MHNPSYNALRTRQQNDKKMKRLLLIIAALTFLGVNAYAQQTVVIQNSQTKQAYDANEFSINGISSRQDIGGVEAFVDCNLSSRYNGTEIHDCIVEIKNYNSFAVTVLYMVGRDKTIGSMVLQPNESKRKLFGTETTGYGGDISAATYSVFTITRKLN